MKLIDKTPFQDEKGNFSLPSRAQAVLKYGLGWFAELEAQKLLIPQFERAFEKSFVLIRNFNLPNSDIVIPLVLVGLGGVYVIYVINSKGHFLAKGSEWSTVDNSGNSQLANLNPLERATQLTRAFQKYLEINKISIPGTVEPIIIAVNPGAHIDSVRPAVKVVKSDAIKGFITSLMQATPIWRGEQVQITAQRIVEPRPAEEPKSEPVIPVAPAASYSDRFEDSAPSSFDSNDLGFSFEEESAQREEEKPSASQPVEQPRPRRAAKPSNGSLFGMSRNQVVVLAAMMLIWVCIMIGFGALILFSQ